MLHDMTELYWASIQAQRADTVQHVIQAWLDESPDLPDLMERMAKAHNISFSSKAKKAKQPKP